MSNKKLELDDKLIQKKAEEIGVVIDGLTMPEIFCILGTVIVELVHNASQQGYKIDDVVSEWLHMMRFNVENMPGTSTEKGN